MNRVRNNLFPFLAACLLLLSSGSVIALASASLRAQRENSFTIPRALVEGRQTFSLLSNSKCFGTISTVFEPVDDFISYSFEGTAKIEAFANETTLSVSGFFQINSLDQIFASLITFELENQRWQVGSSGAVPINWTVKPLSPSATIVTQHGSLPGPLALRLLDEHTYQITHPLLNTNRHQQTKTLPEILLTTAPLELLPGTCEASLTPLKLDPVLTQVLPLMQRLKSFSWK